MTHNKWTLALAACLLGLPALAQAAPLSPIGNWVFEDGESAVEYFHCGTAICGRFSWFKAKQARDGGPLVDHKNPDPTLRTRRLCGLVFVTGLMPAKDGTWGGGKIYSAGSGGFFDLDITRIEPNKLTERGYKGMRLFGKTFTLTRAPADLPRCQA